MSVVYKLLQMPIEACKHAIEIIDTHQLITYLFFTYLDGVGLSEAYLNIMTMAYMLVEAYRYFTGIYIHIS